MNIPANNKGLALIYGVGMFLGYSLSYKVIKQFIYPLYPDWSEPTVDNSPEISGEIPQQESKSDLWDWLRKAWQAQLEIFENRPR